MVVLLVVVLLVVALPSSSLELELLVVLTFLDDITTFIRTPNNKRI